MFENTNEILAKVENGDIAGVQAYIQSLNGGSIYHLPFTVTQDATGCFHLLDQVQFNHPFYMFNLLDVAAVCGNVACLEQLITLAQPSAYSLNNAFKFALEFNALMTADHLFKKLVNSSQFNAQQVFEAKFSLNNNKIQNYMRLMEKDEVKELTSQIIYQRLRSLYAELGDECFEKIKRQFPAIESFLSNESHSLQAMELLSLLMLNQHVLLNFTSISQTHSDINLNKRSVHVPSFSLEQAQAADCYATALPSTKRGRY